MKSFNEFWSDYLSVIEDCYSCHLRYSRHLSFFRDYKDSAFRSLAESYYRGELSAEDFLYRLDNILREYANEYGIMGVSLGYSGYAYGDSCGEYGLMEACGDCDCACIEDVYHYLFLDILLPCIKLCDCLGVVYNGRYGYDWFVHHLDWFLEEEEFYCYAVDDLYGEKARDFDAEGYTALKFDSDTESYYEAEWEWDKDTWRETLEWHYNFRDSREGYEKVANKLGLVIK